MKNIKVLKIFLLVFLLTIISFNYSANASVVENDKKSKVLYELKDWTKITDNVYVSTGEYSKVNMVLVVYDKEATIIDFGNNKAEALRIKEFLTKNNLQLKNMIVTHSHSDHTGNLDMFEVPNENFFYPKVVKDEQIIEMGKEKFKVIATPGHNNNSHISIELVNEHFLVAGDVVITNWLPFLEYGGSYNELKETLEKIKKQKYNIIIPGHGDIFEPTLTVENQLQYINNVYKFIEEESSKINRPTDIISLKEKLYENIKLEKCLYDTSVIDITKQKDIHIKNINKILDAVAMNCFTKGVLPVPKK